MPAAPRQLLFDSTPEIFATDTGGSFQFPLGVGGETWVETAPYDEIRLVIHLWHPSGKRSIDFDQAYVEMRGCFDPRNEVWTKLAEIEPVVPPHNAGESFDGWIVLPVFAATSKFQICGSGFEPRARLQIRASAYLVA